eukprot:TRINITY_DN11471_c0_g1_i1.p1 TRINITY_DN11471_c0_g1~~TRINITY_DN11471_c0_g1_i1.p1  ORF type:complete len:408 (-),score=44.96 TRINITY_DN11471_c0_g1_i1:102-1325(-)
MTTTTIITTTTTSNEGQSNLSTPVTPWTIHPGWPWLMDTSGWSDPKYYKTIRSASIGEDLYVFARGSCAIHFARFHSRNENWTSLPSLNWLTDAGGWGNPIYYETIRFLNIADSLYVFGRGSSDIHLARFNVRHNNWSFLPALAWLGDSGGWNQPKYYQTIRVVNVGKDLCVFGRGSEKVHLARFDTTTDTWHHLPSLKWLGDLQGWGNKIYYETIRVVTISDCLYVFGRGSSEIHFARFDLNNNSWNYLPSFRWLGDGGGWSDPKYYKTIQVVTIGTRLYVFGRGSSSIHLAQFETTTETWSHLPGLEWLGDSEGWGNPMYYESIRVVALNSCLYVFGRGYGHIHFARFDSSNDTWSILPSLEWLRDSGGWNNPIYYETIQVVPVQNAIFVFGRGSHHIHLASFQA